MRGLRARLLLVTVLVAAVAVVASALFSRRVVNTEFRRYVGAEPVNLAPVARELEGLLRDQGSLAGADARLAREARRLRRGLVLADSAGATLAASAEPLRGGHVTLGPGARVRVEGGHSTGSVRHAMLLELVRPPRAAVRAPDGRVAATLFALREPADPGAGANVFLGDVTRGLWLGALAAILVGALLVWFLSGRVLGPIEALTAAAGRMERGDLAARVVPRGRDEVAVLGRRFNAMAESLARSFHLRRQLTHDVAHELRTPLTNLRAQVEALQDGLLAPDAATLGSLHEEVLLLARLVGDLEQLAEAEAGVLRLELAPVDAREALESVVAAFAPRAREQGVTLEARAPGDLTLRADAARLAQILRNLVANALTHTPPGGRVALTAAREGDAVAIEIADTGAGIPPEHLPHVFDRFYRADPARARATGGAGLGLAIVRQLALLHGGDVRAESEPGRGTRIVLRLPAA